MGCLDHPARLIRQFVVASLWMHRFFLVSAANLQKLNAMEGRAAARVGASGSTSPTPFQP